MNIQITFSGMDHSAGLEGHALAQLAKVERLLEHTEKTPITIHMIITSGFTHAHHKVELLVKSPDYNLVAHEENTDAYEAINHVVTKAYSELTKTKERLVDLRKKGKNNRSPEQIEKNLTEE